MTPSPSAGEPAPCGFCASCSVAPYGLADGGTIIRCDHCGACGPRGDDDAEALAAWNRRSATASEQDVERVAEALWQAESLRASDKPRRIAWSEEAEKTRELWRFMARAATAAAAGDEK